MFRKILLALDESESQDSLVSATAAVAASNDAEVVVFHMRSSAEDGPLTIAEVAREQLVAMGVRARAHSGPVDHGHVDSAIERSAGIIGADLIVMGSRGLGELRAALAGSVSRRVVIGTDCPVLLVKGNLTAGWRARDGLRVLAAVGCIEDAEPVLAALSGLRTLGEVVVLGVRQLIPVFAEPAVTFRDLWPWPGIFRIPTASVWMFLKSYVEIPITFEAVQAAMMREPKAWLDGLAP